MLNSVIASLLVASTMSTPIAWTNSNIRVSHAAEVGGIVWTADSVTTTLVTDDGHGWRINGELDPSRLYCVVFDTQGTDNITDDSILMAVAMD